MKIALAVAAAALVALRALPVAAPAPAAAPADDAVSARIHALLSRCIADAQRGAEASRIAAR